MAAAPTAEVLAAWSGLGYNRRALALHRAGTKLAAEGWPATTDGLETLPGVGRYTARAVAALAFGRPVGAVDTNVRRWLVRRFGLPAATPSAHLQAMADALAGAEPQTTPAEAAAWMHASMEFGAMVCMARRPACATCPVRDGCPSRDVAARVPVPRQPAFASSERFVRGQLVRELSAATGHAIPLAQARALAGGHATRPACSTGWSATDWFTAAAHGFGWASARGGQQPLQSARDPHCLRPAGLDRRADAVGRAARHRWLPPQPAHVRVQVAFDRPVLCRTVTARAPSGPWAT